MNQKPLDVSAPLPTLVAPNWAAREPGINDIFGARDVVSADNDFFMAVVALDAVAFLHSGADYMPLAGLTKRER